MSISSSTSGGIDPSKQTEGYFIPAAPLPPTPEKVKLSKNRKSIQEEITTKKESHFSDTKKMLEKIDALDEKIRETSRKQFMIEYKADAAAKGLGMNAKKADEGREKANRVVKRVGGFVTSTIGKVREAFRALRGAKPDAQKGIVHASPDPASVRERVKTDVKQSQKAIFAKETALLHKRTKEDLREFKKLGLQKHEENDTAAPAA